ncbi:MAG: hypothetical protein AAF961_19315, partial [Planctomycetota bacterium]
MLFTRMLRKTAGGAPSARASSFCTRPASQSGARRLLCEPLENRRLLAVITVNSLSDTLAPGEGVTTLRAAVAQANAQAGPDEIRFDASLFAAGPTELRLTGGQLELADSVSIVGPGADRLTINATLQSRHFDV